MQIFRPQFHHVISFLVVSLAWYFCCQSENVAHCCECSHGFFFLFFFQMKTRPHALEVCNFSQQLPIQTSDLLFNLCKTGLLLPFVKIVEDHIVQPIVQRCCICCILCILKLSLFLFRILLPFVSPFIIVPEKLFRGFRTIH